MLCTVEPRPSAIAGTGHAIALGPLVRVLFGHHPEHHRPTVGETMPLSQKKLDLGFANGGPKS